jgi:hypothetical protein
MGEKAARTGHTVLFVVCAGVLLGALLVTTYGVAHGLVAVLDSIAAGANGS